MRYDYDSSAYAVNWWAFLEMDEIVPMTKSERKALRNWARKGYDIETNPWDYIDCDGTPLNYLQAYRLEYGYSSGPWDYWKGPNEQLYWDDEHKTFIPKDELC